MQRPAHTELQLQHHQQQQQQQQQQQPQQQRLMKHCSISHSAGSSSRGA